MEYLDKYLFFFNTHNSRNSIIPRKTFREFEDFHPDRFFNVSPPIVPRFEVVDNKTLEMKIYNHRDHIPKSPKLQSKMNSKNEYDFVFDQNKTDVESPERKCPKSIPKMIRITENAKNPFDPHNIWNIPTQNIKYE